MTIAVFYVDPKTHAPGAEFFGDAELLPSLAACKRLREAGMRHVCQSTDFADKVGADGVSDVLPEGYDWSKRRHVGPVGRTSGDEITPSGDEIIGEEE